MNQNNDLYEVIGTKVSPTFAKTFRRLCRSKGLKPYQVMQMMVDTFVRYTDDQHNLSQDMEQMMTVFEHMAGWREAFNLADPTPDRTITEAIYLLTAEKRKGARAIMVHRPYFGDWTETANIQVILERVIEVLAPERYRRLRALAVDMDCKSILELLDTMIDNHVAEQEAAELRKDFEDCNRHDYGRPIIYGERTKRKHHKTPDTLQQRITFANEDVPDNATEI